jgi:hypothetical protein
VRCIERHEGHAAPLNGYMITAKLHALREYEPKVIRGIDRAALPRHVELLRIDRLAQSILHLLREHPHCR